MCKVRDVRRSQLFVEDNLVVDNNGLHGSREICRPFDVTKGTVRIRVKAFVNTGAFVLHAFWRFTRLATSRAALTLDKGPRHPGQQDAP